MTRFIKVILILSVFIAVSGCKDNSSQYYLKNGSAKYKLKDYKNAVEDLTKAIELEDDLAEAFYLRALCNSDLGKYKESLYDFNKAIEFKKDYSEAIFNRAFYAKEPLKDYEGAILDYDLFISLNIDGDNSFAYNNRGFAKFSIEDYEGAIEDISTSLNINSNNSYAYKNRAKVFIAMDSISAACDDLQKAKDLGFSSSYGNEVDELINKICL